MSAHSSIAAAASFYSTIWAARLAITFTIMRVTPWKSQKKAMIAIAVAIFLQWAVLVVQMFWVCEKGETAWDLGPIAMCPGTNLYVYISQVIGEYSLTRFFSDQRMTVISFISPLQSRLSPGFPWSSLPSGFSEPFVSLPPPASVWLWFLSVPGSPSSLPSHTPP